MSISILDTKGNFLANNGSNGISIVGPDGALMPNDGTNGISILGTDGAYQPNDGTVDAYSILDSNGSLAAYIEGATYSILAFDGSMASHNDTGLPGGVVMAMRANDATAVGTVETWLGQELEAVMAFCDGDSWANIVARPASIATDYGVRMDALKKDWAVPLASNTQGIAETIAGTHDASITALAENILANDSNNQIWIRLGWEMNLTSYPWADTNATTTQYIQAFQRVVGLFRAVSDKFIFGWIPNWGGSANPEDWYPGDDYVDYVGMNMYFKTLLDQPSGQTGPEVWANKLGATYGLNYIASFATTHSKRLAVPEWGIDADEPAIVAGMATYIEDNRSKFLYHGYWDQDTPVVTKISGNQFPESSSAFLYNFGTYVEWTPSSYFGADLYDWFDASATDSLNLTESNLVTDWTSLVGTGRNMSQGSDSAKPLWSATARNNLPGITSDGTADYLVQTAVTGIPAGQAACGWAVQGYGFPSLLTGFKYYLAETVENTFSSTSRALGSGNGNARFQASGTVSSGQYHSMDRSVVCSIPAGATPNVSISVDGGTVTTAGAAVGTFTVTRATLFAGGGSGGTYGGFSETTLQEIIKINRAFTTAETDMVHGYLAHKWGRASALAATHPYKANPPVII